MAEVFRSNGQDFYIPKITISLVNEADTERCLLFLFGSIPSLLKVQRIAKIFVFYRCCDSLHLVPFFESQEAAASLPPSVCKGAEDRKATISFPLHQSFQSSICRTKAIVQASIYQKPFGIVGQRGVARHLQSKCLAQSATFK
tara:strand:- start:111 stop:539 length:429 start_codon:yes stop_codon:yes gene_type:complete